jgi:GNAT superfamily N-acetyltransferase
MRVKTFKMFRESADSKRAECEEMFRDELKSQGIDVVVDHTGYTMSIDGKTIGDMRLDLSGEWAMVEMIDISQELQGKGIGTKIYEALYKAAVSAGFKGISSMCFDPSGSGQQRSPAASAVMKKMVNRHGGSIVKIEPSEEDLEDLEDSGAPYYGPPYEDYYVDGSGRVAEK